MTDESGTAEAEAKKARKVGRTRPAAGKGGVEKSPAKATASTPATPAEASSGPQDGPSSTPDPEDHGGAADAQDKGRDGGEGEGKASAEEFAREHDPAQHDIAAGEESRQPGDWTADEADGRVWDAQGNLEEGTSIGGSATAQDVVDDAAAEGVEARDGRRTSSLDEVRDGGYSVGSAAPIDDGAMPLGHPVKAWEATKTFITPDGAGYDEREPDLWFTDAGAAGRAGFGPGS